MLKWLNILLLYYICNNSLFAQQLKKFITREIQETSFYDIYPVNNNRFILAGKNGVIAETTAEGEVTTLKINSEKANLLKSDKINDSLIMIIGDKGSIYTLNTSQNSWSEQFLKGYKSKALYNMCTDNKGAIYINGGHSKIACGQRAIPNGFILKSENGGKSWKKVYYRTSKMVWDIKYNPTDNKLYAITYSISGSSLIASSNQGKTWKTICTSPKKDLFHALFIDDNGKIIISGGNYSNEGGRGAIYEWNGNYLQKYTCTYFVWDVVSSPEVDIASCSKGWIVYRNKTGNNTNWQEMHSTADYNLYEVEKISDTSFLLGGSRKTLIRFDLDAHGTSFKD